MGMQRPPLIEIYNCLCDETRLRIVHLLAKSPLCVCHLQDILGLTQVAASKPLAYLRQKGLADSRRHEQWMILLAAGATPARTGLAVALSSGLPADPPGLPGRSAQTESPAG